MTKTRRVGTITLGTTLITFGILFLLNIFTSMVSYHFVMKLWPIIFIFLGTEVLVSYFLNKEEKFIYDVGAVFIIIALSFFAMGMAGIEFIIAHASNGTIYF